MAGFAPVTKKLFNRESAGAVLAKKGKKSAKVGKVKMPSKKYDMATQTYQ